MADARERKSVTDPLSKSAPMGLERLTETLIRTAIVILAGAISIRLVDGVKIDVTEILLLRGRG